MTLDPTQLSIPELHGYLQGAVAPRPIAFAATMDAEGQVNLSPFSFFNVFGTNPPTLIFSPNRRVRDGSTKHTLENVLEVPEVTINMVDFSMVEQMSLSSCEYPRGVNEFEKAGFTEVASSMVRPPRVGESKVSFECKVLEVKQLGDAGGAPNLVICQVVMLHVDESILDEKGRIDQRKTDWVARLGGDWYARASGDALFEVPKPNLQLGIGVDQIPEWIIKHPDFTPNDLGRLGNVERLPDAQQIAEYRATAPADTDFVQLGLSLLRSGKVAEAWLALSQLAPN
jgi:flavin reductase (DIM6/NTAB) family NADH-FMN oxidoreductase RutF